MTGPRDDQRDLRDLPAAWLDWLTWPLLVAASLLATAAVLPRLSATLATIVLTAGLVGVVLVLERVRPQRPRPPRREPLRVELGHVLLGLEVGGGLGYLGAVGLAEVLAPLRAGAAWWPASWPLAVQVAVALIVVDLGSYAQHRAVHRLGAAWPLHAIHHQPDLLDVLKTGRFHLVDLATNTFVAFLPVLALGAPAEVVAWAAIGGTVAGVLQHANVRMPTPAWLDAIIATPAVHWRHHGADDDGNFASMCPLIDRALGTWAPTHGRRPARLGLVDDPLPAGFLPSILAPFRRPSRR